MSLFSSPPTLVNEFIWLTLSTYFATQQRASYTTARAFHNLYTSKSHDEYRTAWLECNQQLIQREIPIPVNIYELFLILRTPTEHSTSNSANHNKNNTSDILNFVNTNSHDNQNEEQHESASSNTVSCNEDSSELEEEEFKFDFDKDNASSNSNSNSNPSPTNNTTSIFPKIVPLPIPPTSWTPADGLFDDEFEDNL